MERTEVLELMAMLKLYGMRAAYDEVMASGIKPRHEPPRIVGDLLSAEIAEKQARSIKYQLTIARLSIVPSSLRGPVAFLVGERLAGVAAALRLAIELRSGREVDFAVGVVPNHVTGLAKCSYASASTCQLCFAGTRRAIAR
jgi:hypothetical protein